MSLEIFNGVCGFNKFTGTDFPGIVSAILFYSGCNLRCPYCQNPALVLGQTNNFNPSVIENFLINRKGIIDGVVITGGEPTIHKNLPTLISHIRNFGYKVKLDTNGLNPEILKKCEVDYIALDIKTTPAKYSTHLCAKLSVKDVKKNLFETINFMKSNNIDGELRITVAPKVIEESDFAEIAELCSGMPVFLQNFRTRFEVLDKKFFGNNIYNPDLTKKLKDYLKSTAKTVRIREYAENSKISEKKNY